MKIEYKFVTGEKVHIKVKNWITGTAEKTQEISNHIYENTLKTQQELPSKVHRTRKNMIIEDIRMESDIRYDKLDIKQNTKILR